MGQKGRLEGPLGRDPRGQEDVWGGFPGGQGRRLGGPMGTMGRFEGSSDAYMPMCDLDFSCGQAGGWEDESGVIHEVFADLNVDGGLYW